MGATNQLRRKNKQMRQQLLSFRKRLGETEIFATPLGLGTDVSCFKNEHGELPLLEKRIDNIHYAVREKGINYIDTAPLYNDVDYNAQEELGTALEGIPRDHVYITTKSQNKWEVDAQKNRDTLCKSFENSLKELKTEYVDGYLLHDIPIVKEHPEAIDLAVKEIQELKEQELIKGGIGIGTVDINVVDAILKQDWLDFIQVGAQYNNRDMFMKDYFPILKEKKIAFVNCQVFVKQMYWDKENTLDFHQSALAYSVGSPDVDLSLVGMMYPENVDKNVQTTLYMEIHKREILKQREQQNG